MLLKGDQMTKSKRETSLNFLYEISRGHCTYMESIRGSTKDFLQRSACTTCRETFLPQNFHVTWYVDFCKGRKSNKALHG